ncbi:hypothetical protein Ocin01_03735 [Orchesella cincta]|uniref:Uncharacterized protein n=1 Tax=Orchesella cincta TaxID=48709 RepID=A0A1D2ND54_ORCCI|nr:hypothetical protein Ocin01_03735 [Orchesella cincta]
MMRLYIIVFVAAACLQQTESLSPNQRLMQLNDMCCYMGKYRLGLIPDPFRCDSFNSCRPMMDNDGRYRLDPLQQKCESGLYYDFRRCRCLRPEEVTCFDAQLSDHIRDFFNCTTEFREEGIDGSCGRGAS